MTSNCYRYIPKNDNPAIPLFKDELMAGTRGGCLFTIPYVVPRRAPAEPVRCYAIHFQARGQTDLQVDRNPLRTVIGASGSIPDQRFPRLENNTQGD